MGSRLQAKNFTTSVVATKIWLNLSNLANLERGNEKVWQVVPAANQLDSNWSSSEGIRLQRRWWRLRSSRTAWVWRSWIRSTRQSSSSPKSSGRRGSWLEILAVARVTGSNSGRRTYTAGLFHFILAHNGRLKKSCVAWIFVQIHIKKTCSLQTRHSNQIWIILFYFSRQGLQNWIKFDII